MELTKQYNPAEHESELYKLWEESGAFKPNMDSAKEPFSIVMPPPNANGHIHVGTAMFVIEDIMTRYRRMQGHPTLWLPGTDHAGIETQVVFERELAKQGKSRFDYSPSEFYQAALDFTLGNQSTILSELKSMGFSADWSRLQFTLDQPILDVVYETFKMLHKDGLIYRANRIVNWCTHCNSGFADIEVKYREQTDPLYYIKYGPFVVATVRPEVIFADTGIAVNPKDERYAKWVGKEVEVEHLWGPRKLRVIADSHVDPAFGTGVVKLTPAHDPNDWDMAQRHDLEVIQGIGTDGLLTENAGRFAGMPVAEARQEIAHEIRIKKLMDHIEENYTHSVAYHDRCGTLIEPLTTEQWWLSVKPLVQAAIKAVKNNNVVIVPERFTGPYVKWLENLRDWNISRQNWFGISIPVYYNGSGDTSKDEYIITTNEQDAIDYYGEGNYEKETDTFDTWFSSSQWPYATMMASGDFDTFYPTSVLETGRDILFIWVTRMLMFGVYRTGKVPFKTVYLHGLVNDAHGKKMSKSKGNVVNPLDMTSKYGTDALRLALTIGVTPGKDAALSEEKIQGYRNFCNKLWNVARFIMSQLPADYSPTPFVAHSLADKWIIGKLAQTIASVTKDTEEYRFSEAGAATYSFIWNDFADWYIEASKDEANIDLLVHVLETVLKLVHPIAPFVSEAIWQKMAWHKDNLITSSWPESKPGFSHEMAEFEGLKAIIQSIRAMKIELGVGKVAAICADETIKANADLVQRLAGLSKLKAGKGSGLRVVSSEYAMWLDVDAEKVNTYKQKLQDQLADKQKFVDGLQKRLGNASYIENAPAEIVAESREQLEEGERVMRVLREQIEAIG